MIYNAFSHRDMLSKEWYIATSFLICSGNTILSYGYDK